MINKNSYKKLVTNTFIFAIGNISTSLVSFLLVPLYTKYLSPSDYGTVDLILNLISMFIPIVTICITDSVIRFSMDKKYNKVSVFNTALLVCLSGCGIFLAIAPILNYIEEFKQYVIFIYLIASTNILCNLLFAFIKALNKLKFFATIGFIRTIIMLVSNIVLLTIYEMGVKGYLLSLIISNIILILIVILKINIVSYINHNSINKKTSIDMIKFSLPLIPNNMSGWALSSIDRYMVTNVFGTGGNGLYAVARKIPNILNMVSSVFSQAWNFSALEEQNNENKEKYYRSMYRIYSSLMFTSCSIMLLLIKPIMKILVDPQFYLAWQFTPFLLLSVVFQSFSGFYVSFFIIYRKTNFLFFSTLFGAIVNGALNWILIPIWGINGATFATVITFLAVWIVRVIVIKDSIDLNINYIKIFLNSMFAILQALVLINTSKYWLYIQLIFMGVVILLNQNELKDIIKKIILGVKKK